MTPRIEVVSALVLSLAALSCAGAPPPVQAPAKCPPQNVTVSLLASPTINPTSQGETRPVVIRVYQLKSDARFYNASFDKIWNDDKAALGEDLFKVEEVQLYPATRVDLKFDRVEAVQHVAAVALFQTPKGKSWFSSIDLPPVPEGGSCGVQVCDGEDDDCAPVNLQTPHFSFWIDGSKVDDGVEHNEDFPKPGPMRKKAR